MPMVASFRLWCATKKILMHIHSLALTLPLLAVALPAQTATPAVAEATAPHILLDTVGPDGWRIRLGPTNVGSMLESEQGRKLWEPRMVPMLGMWQQLVGDEAAFATTKARWLGYGGRVRIGMWLAPDAGMRRSPISHFAVVFDGDGRSDLDALANDLRDLQYKTVPGEWEERDVGGTKLAVRTQGGDVMCAPYREGDHLLLAVAASGDDLAPALQHARELAHSATGKAPAPNTPALRVTFDFATIVATAMAASGSDAAWMKVLGLPSLGTHTMTVGTAGPHVQVELAQQFTSDDRGLFGAFFPAAPGLPALLAAAPGDKDSWKAGHLDLDALYTTIEQAVVASERTTAEEFRAEVNKEIGVDLQRDVLAHLNDEVLMTGYVPEGIAKDTTWSLAFGVRDTTAFGKSLMTMLPQAKPFLSREAEEKHGDIPVYRYGGMLGYDLWLSVGNGVFVIAGGRDAEDLVGAALDRGKALPAVAAAGAPAAALPTPHKGFEDLQRFLPGGLNGLARGDVGSVVVLPTEAWGMLVGSFAPFVFRPFEAEAADGDQEEQQQAMRTMLRTHSLDTLRTATGYTGWTWRWRLFW